MKKRITLCFYLLLFGFSNSLSQTVNGIPIHEIDSEYIEIQGFATFNSNKITIQIDFGQGINPWKRKESQIKDENDKLVMFHSMIDAMNFLDKLGYEFIDSYIIHDEDSHSFYYLMKKKRERD